MNIVIDIRALMGGKTSGVEVYIRNLIRNIAEIDEKNTYILFANASKNQEKFLPKIDRKNIIMLQTKIPNKLLNLSLSFFQRPRLDKIILKQLQQKYPAKKIQKIDIFFMPDLRLSALSKGIKKISTIHDLSFVHFPEFFSKKSRLWYKILNPKREIEKSNRIIAVSNFTKKDLIKTYKISKEKIGVIYEGAPTRIKEKRENLTNELIQKKYKLPPKYFLFLATLEPRKNMERLIKAFLKFKKTNPENKIKLVMAGLENNKIFSKVTTNNFLNPEISWIGFVDEKDKPILMKNAEALIYISIFEGFGLPLVEAMKSKTPIITSNLSSMPEIVGKGAILVDPYNIEQIAKALKEIQNATVRKKLKTAMALQIKKFTWKKTAQETVKLFSKI